MKVETFEYFIDNNLECLGFDELMPLYLQIKDIQDSIFAIHILKLGKNLSFQQDLYFGIYEWALKSKLKNLIINFEKESK